MDYKKIEKLLYEALVLQNNGKFSQAEASYKKLLKINPNEDRALHFLGILAFQQNRYEDALVYYNKAIKINPQPHYYKDLGDMLFDKYKMQEVIIAYEKAIELKTDEIEVFHNLALAYWYVRKFDKSFELMSKVISADPSYVDAIFSLGNFYLQLQLFDKGWELYDLRFQKSEGGIVIPNVNSPLWDGSSLIDKTIFIYPEQGFGDEMQFSRYLFEISNIAEKIIYKPLPQMEKLMRNSLKSINNLEVISAETLSDTVKCDYHISLMSIPKLVKTNASNVPCPVNYLKAIEAKTEIFMNKYFSNDKFKIGIFWRGNKIGLKDRPIPLNLLSKVALVEGTEVYSLQKGEGIEELSSIPENIKIINLGDEFEDFSDTASAIENLDLVISIDSSIIHLAGALGKQAWLLLPFTPEWRWGLEGESTMWYKNVKLFRQTEISNWETVINNIIDELTNKLN